MAASSASDEVDATAPLTLRFGTPVEGWLEVELVGREGASRLDASDVPADSLAMLVAAAIDLVDGVLPRDVEWFLEPVLVRWSFAAAHDHIAISARDHVTVTRIGAATAYEIGWVVWEAVHRLEADPAWRPPGGAQAWSHPFPSTAVAVLHDKLRAGPSGRR